MFRYEKQAFSASTDLMHTVCRELSAYEEEIRALSAMLDRNPEIPAPRYKLKKSIERLEREETSLNLIRRKLESVRRLYESSEDRIRDLAEETERVNGNEKSSSENEERPRGLTAEPDGPRMRLPRMDWKWPFNQPLGPGPGYYCPPGRRDPFGPFKPYRPVFPFPPRRPAPLDFGYLKRILAEFFRQRFHTGLSMPPPRVELMPYFPNQKVETILLPHIIDETAVRPQIRLARWDRIENLFGTDHS